MPRKTAGEQPSAPASGGFVSKEDIEPSTRVLRRFRLVFNAVRTHFQQIEKQVGVGGAQVWALSVIQAQPGISVGSLAQAMDIHQTTASNLVKSMVQAQLVITQRDPADRRATCLSITAQGADILRKAPGPMSGVLPAALAALDEETLARLDGDLAKLLDKLNTDGRAAGIPLAQM